MRRPNDVGGLPAGPIGSRGHEPERWETLLTALVATFGPAKARINCIDEFRRAREDLDTDFYNSLTYFELWTQGFINLMEEKGVLTRAEVRRRAGEIKNRWKKTS
jgi:nitrile hydratase beta subunit-like protein